MQGNASLGAHGDIGGVSDDNDCASITMKLLKQLYNGLAAIQCAGRFVSQDAAQSSTIARAMTTRCCSPPEQSIGPMVSTMTQPHSVQASAWLGAVAHPEERLHSLEGAQHFPVRLRAVKEPEFGRQNRFPGCAYVPTAPRSSLSCSGRPTHNCQCRGVRGGQADA